mgnify:CR=1 FL=1
MVQLQDWQIKAPAVLCHRQMNSIFFDLLPLERQCLSFPEAGKQQKLVEYPVDWVGKVINGFPPVFDVINDTAIRLF